jgi:exodeoxyribonuclease VII large subunit
MLDVLVQRLDESDHRLGEAIDRRIEKREFEFDKLASRLETISPLKTLARGYCLTMDSKDGSIISRISQVRIGQRIETQLSDGRIISQIEKIQHSE